MSEPRQVCRVCGAVETCRVQGREFPPDAAKRRLANRCRAAGHASEPQYWAGMSHSLDYALSVLDRTNPDDKEATT